MLKLPLIWTLKIKHSNGNGQAIYVIWRELQCELDLSAINRIYQWLTRESEDRHLIANSPTQLITITRKVH